VQTFGDAYVNFIDVLTPQYTDMFARLVAGETPLALNCSVGKDRTGMGSALILSTLGVSRDVVVADYALTQFYTPPSMYAQAMSSQQRPPGLDAKQMEALRQLPPEVLSVIMGSDPDVMHIALAQVDAKFGGPVELVKAKFGVHAAGIARMRSYYLV
jgi:protein-tyrosine phosphatase